MEILFRISLLIAGIINFIPTIGAFFPSKIPLAYGITIPDGNVELLLRHRAILFGILGGLMIYSAITKKYYELSTMVGLISMISFMLLFYTIDGAKTNELTKVMRIDIFATAILLIGLILFKWKG